MKFKVKSSYKDMLLNNKQKIKKGMGKPLLLSRLYKMFNFATRLFGNSLIMETAI